MPNLQSHASTFRAGRYTYTGYVGFVPPTVVFSRAVNMASIPADQIMAITFDDAYSGVGDYTDVREDMTVLVYHQNTSTLKGRLRVAAGAASSTVLQVNEFSPGTLQLADNDRIDVVEEWRIWDKLVEASAQFRKDSRITFVDQTDDYKPVANGGGAWFGFVDPGESYATIDFDWTSSFPVDPNNSSGLTYSVDAKDATITVGDDESATCTMQVPAGFRHIELTVTDADNGESTTIQIPVYVFDGETHVPLSAAIDNLRFDGTTKGWALDGLRLPKASQAALANLPDGALIVYFEDERYGGVRASYGSNAPASGRSHIKFVGYLVADTLRLTPDEDEVLFEALSPLGILEQTAALPQLMIRDSSPSNWQEMKGLTVNLALWYLWYWHASIASAFDFLWVDGTDLAYSRLAVEDASSVAGQLRDIASSINVELTCDRLGRLLLIRDPNYLSLNDRNARTVVYNATTADIIELEERHEHRRRVKVVVGEGITAGATAAAQAPVFSLSPGKAPGEGAATETFNRKIVANQAEMNRITGERYAALNGLYWDETTKQIRHVPQGARWIVPDGYDWLDPAHMEFLTFVLPASSNSRGVAYTTDTRWLVREVNITYDAEVGAKDIEWTVDHETHGPSGVTDIRPQPSDNGIDISFPPIDITFPGWGVYEPPLGGVPGSGYGRGTVTMFAPNSDGYLYYCGPDLTGAGFDTPPEAGGPRWQRIAMNFSVAGTPHQWIIDAFCPNIVGTGTEVIGWLVNHNTIYYVTDANTLTPTFTRVTNADTSMPFAFASSATIKQVAAERGTRNRLIAAHQGQGTGTYYTFTTDGVNWKTDTQLDSTNSAASLLPGLYVSGKSSLVLVGTLTTIKSSTDSTPTTGMFSDVPSGLDPGSKGAGDIYFPWAQPSDDLMYFGGSNGSRNYLYRGSYVNGTKTDVTPGVSGAYYGPVLSKNIAASPANRNRIAVVGFNALGGPGGIGNVAIFTATDGGVSASSWTLRYGPVGAQTNGSYNHIDMTDDNTIFAWGLGAIGVSYDFGQTWQDKRGNIPTDFPSAGRFVGIYGG